MKNEISTNVIKVIDIPEVTLTGKYKIIDNKTIGYIEKRIRNSYEYRAFINYLKHTLDINTCSFYEGYSIENGFKIEIHHSPLTLFDYTLTVCNKHMELNDGFFYDLEVAEEVTRLHFLFKVGLVPLNPTAHELVHSGNLEIHPDLIIGDYQSFIQEYEKWLPDNVRDKLIHIEELKEKDSKEMPVILNKQPIKLMSPYKKLSINSMENIVVDKIKLLEKIGK